MRLARFLYRDREHFGVIDGESAVLLDHRVGQFRDLVADPAAGAPRADDPRVGLESLRWLPPFTADAKILCVGLNYRTHTAETDRPASEHPTIFIRFPDSFVGSGGDVWQEADTHSLDWEGEVAVVIGRPARRVTRATAWSHVAGLTCMAENSERRWQLHSSQATAGKNWTASGACGPWISTVDDVGRDPVDLTTRLNGEVVQHDCTSNLTFDIPTLISYIGTFTQLRPGDVIATGTPAGVGYRRQPPRFLTPGDELEVVVSGVGTLRHGVARPNVS